jgi:peroxiredoxin
MYCRGQLVKLQNDLPILQRAGYGLAAISYDSAAVLHEFASRKNITFPLLADHESEVIRTFAVTNQAYAKGALLDVNSEQITNALGDVPVYGVAYPSVFVIDPSGKIVWRFVSEADELRLTGTAILERAFSSIADASRLQLPSGRIQVVSTASNTDVGLGNRLIIGLELKIPSGFHIYGPSVGHDYHGLSWKMDPSSCWYENDFAYPQPQLKQFSFQVEELPVYVGSLRLTRELVLKPVLSATQPSLYQLFEKLCLDKEARVKASGRLNFQACDDRRCYPPQSIAVEWKFHFVPPDSKRSPPELRREFEH